MKLYEIDEALEKCFDTETGEIVDEEAFNELLEEKDKKIEGVMCIVKNRAALIEELKAEKKRITDRITSLENRNEGTIGFLDHVLAGHSFETAKGRCSYRKSQAVNILDVAKIPKKYVEEVYDLKPDKAAIKKAINGGEKVPGAELEERNSLSVK